MHHYNSALGNSPNLPLPRALHKWHCLGHALRQPPLYVYSICKPWSLCIGEPGLHPKVPTCKALHGSTSPLAITVTQLKSMAQIFTGHHKSCKGRSVQALQHPNGCDTSASRPTPAIRGNVNTMLLRHSCHERNREAREI